MSDRSLEDKIVESIPNISEGRNREIVESIVDEVRNTEGCILMNYSSDKDHNRSVISYIGSPKAVEEASFRLMKKALNPVNCMARRNGCTRDGVANSKAGVGTVITTTMSLNVAKKTNLLI